MLVDDSDPPHSMAGTKYRVELDTGEVIEGYLDEEGKARLEGIPKTAAKVAFPDIDAEDWHGS